MKREQLLDRILGSLTAAGIGDALGAPTEGMSYAEILQIYGSRVENFIDGAVNPYFHNAQVGEVTDDTSQMYEMALALADARGNFKTEDAVKGLLNWADRYPRYYPQMAGPTTRLVVEALRAGEDPLTVGRTGGTPERGSTNGAAMRIAAAGLANPGDLHASIRDAVTMTQISHGTQIGFASACAVACAISAALTDHPDIYDILKAALFGAREGNRLGHQQARVVPGTTVQHKLEKAISVIYDAQTMEEAEARLNDAVGGDSSAAASAVAVAVGLFAAADGDPRKTLIGAANVGADTDTIGCIAGMILGAYCGYAALPDDWVQTFERVNAGFDMKKLAERLTAIAEKKMPVSE